VPEVPERRPLPGQGTARLKDGLWAVVEPTWVAGFVVENGHVVDCAPILRARLSLWVTKARWVCP
jgi:hypothetical protein